MSWLRAANRRHPAPGDCLIGVAPALAAAALAFNAGYLRPHHPSPLTGKLSDVAINLLLPFVIVAGAEYLAFGVAWFRKRRWQPLSWRGRWIACASSALYFTLHELMPGFSAVHFRLLAILDLPFGGQRSFARNVVDPGDLLTLAATLVAGWLLTRPQKASLDPAC